MSCGHDGRFVATSDEGTHYCVMCYADILLGRLVIARDALTNIVEQCPNPKSPYGMAVLEIAKTGIKESA